jgi:hypothetical protein
MGVVLWEWLEISPGFLLDVVVEAGTAESAFVSVGGVNASKEGGFSARRDLEVVVVLAVGSALYLVEVGVVVSVSDG